MNVHTNDCPRRTLSSAECLCEHQEELERQEADYHDTPQDTCPKCKSTNIANEGPPEDGLLFVTCHDCSYQWNEPSGAALTQRLTNENGDKYRAAAKRIWGDEGSIEFDDDAKVSRADTPDAEPGAYVQAWVWVGNDIAGVE